MLQLDHRHGNVCTCTGGACVTDMSMLQLDHRHGSVCTCTGETLVTDMSMLQLNHRGYGLAMTGFALSCLWACVAAAVATAAAGARSLRLARAASLVMVAGAAIPTAVLAEALWSLDLSLTYVADHARVGTSGLYRLSGLWGGASGSLLMFTAMVAAAVAALVWTQPRPTARSAGRWGSLSVAVLAGAVLATANPFRQLAIPAIEGAGLQPILEHPAMLYHPPLLYLGQVSTIVPFLVAVASPLNPGTRRALRGWLGLSLVLLTAGLATGSNWAYVELGWGGFWGWDPVENGILVAWLLVLAALHAVGQPGHGRAIRILCGLPWTTVLVASSVTRAGVGGSVHAFADDERVSWILTGLVVATAVVVGSARGDRAGADLAQGDQPSRPHRHQWFRITCVALATAAALLILVGVLYPIPAAGEPLVTGRYYATLLAPLAIVALGAAGAVVGGRATVWSAAGALAGVIAAAAAGARSPFALCVAAGVGAILVNLVDGLRSRTRGRWPMRVGHLGFAVLLIGVAGSTQADRVTVGLDVGEEIEVGGRSFRHVGVEVTRGPTPGSNAVVATVEVRDGDDMVATLRPSLVAFPDRSVLLAETALHSRPARDIQVVLRTAADSGAALYRVSVAPLVMWVWWGSVLLAGAGLMVAFHAAMSRARQAGTASRPRDVAASGALGDADGGGIDTAAEPN